MIFLFRCAVLYASKDSYRTLTSTETGARGELRARPRATDSDMEELDKLASNLCDILVHAMNREAFMAVRWARRRGLHRSIGQERAHMGPGGALRAGRSDHTARWLRLGRTALRHVGARGAILDSRPWVAKHNQVGSRAHGRGYARPIESDDIFGEFPDLRGHLLARREELLEAAPEAPAPRRRKIARAVWRCGFRMPNVRARKRDAGEERRRCVFLA